MDDNRLIKHAFRSIRKKMSKLKINQNELSSLIGVNVSTLNRNLNRKTEMSLSTFLKISSILNIDDWGTSRNYSGGVFRYENLTKDSAVMLEGVILRGSNVVVACKINKRNLDVIFYFERNNADYTNIKIFMRMLRCEEIIGSHSEYLMILDENPANFYFLKERYESNLC